MIAFCTHYCFLEFLEEQFLQSFTILFIHLFYQLLKVYSTELACVLLLEGLVEWSWKQGTKNVREESILLFYLFLQELFEQSTKSISFSVTRRKITILCELMDQNSEPFSHEETLNEGVDVTGVAHILEPSVPETNFSFLPVLNISPILNLKFSDGQLIEHLMNDSGLDSRVELFLDFMKESFRCLAEICESVFIEGVEFNNQFVAAHKIDFSQD